MENTFDQLVDKAIALGALEARVISTEQIVFDSRSYLKCRFGCHRWGRYWTCPPHLDLPPEKFREAFREYTSALVIKSAEPKVGQEVTVGIEKEAMMVSGCTYAFAMVLCVACEDCAYPEPCRYPHLARPSMDAYGIDIGRTVESMGFKVEFDPNGKLLPAWYSMVLLD